MGNEVVNVKDLKVIPGGYGQEYCLFGCSIWGSSIERPEDCPIEVLT